MKIRLRKTLLVMKFLCFFFLLSVSVSAASYSQNARFTLALENVALTDVFSTIRKSSEFTFIYNMDDVRNIRVKSINVHEATIQEILDEALRNTGFVYQIEDHVIVIQPQETKEEKKSVRLKGWVHDKKKEPLPGVTVRMVGVSLGTATNAQGWFAIDLPVTKGEVEFSFVGYKKQKVSFTEKTDTLYIVMEEDMHQVDEVVVTGIFNKPKESFTGAVTAVTKEEIKANYSRNLLQTLSNLDPSFRIIQNNTQGSNPNALPEIQLRGASTFANVSDLQNANRASLNYPLFIMDGFEVSLERVMDLNDNEVENITILKDASATALYGSRGANGVVVITTIRPEAGKLTVSYDGTVNIQVPDLSSYSYLATAEEKFGLENAYNIYEGYDAIYEEVKAAVDNGVNYNWLKLPVRTGVGQRHRLNFMGGSDEWRFRFDLSYDGEVGVMKGSERDNYNGTLEVNYMTDKWTIVQSFSVGVNTSANSPYGDFSSYAAMNRYWEPYDENGKPVESFVHPTGAGSENPLYDWAVGCGNKAKYTSFRSGTSVRYAIKSGFDVMGSIGLTRQISQSDNFMPPSHKNFATVDLEQKGRYGRTETNKDSWRAALTVNYANTFKEKHMLTVNMNGEIQEDLNDRVNWAATGFINDDIDHIGTSLGYPNSWGTNGEQTTTRRISLRGALNYYYDMRYFLDISYSTDGSSSFGSDSRWGSFYAFGGGWNLSNESFIADHVGWISDLKLRYSFGVSGNMGFSPQDAIETYSNANNETYLNNFILLRGSVANPNLKWQNTYQHNVGVDFAIWNGRLQFQANYFNKLTNNTVADIYLPISHGKEMIKGNIGKIRNEGWDFNVTGYVIRNTEKNMMWSITGRFYGLKNTVVKLSPAFKETLEFTYGGMQASSDYYKYKEGHSMDAIYGIPTLGVDPLTGHRLYLTKDGQVTPHQDPSNMVYLGDLQPKVNGSISTSFSYKGLSVNLGFSVKWGGYQVNFTEMQKGENLTISQNIDSRILGKIWTKPGDQALYKKYGEGYTYPTDMFVHKDNVFSCTNINVMYQLPHALSKKYLGLEKLSVGAYLSDIFYLSSIKRERGTAYPFSRNPNFTISCTF